MFVAGSGAAGAIRPKLLAMVAVTARVRPALAAAMASAVRCGMLGFGFMVSSSEVLSEA
jgi:hypothetical protein